MSDRCCKDCITEFGSYAYKNGVPRRPADHPGPRCATHHRRGLRDQKDRAAARRVEKVYGLSPEDDKRVLRLQGGKCAICQRATGATKRLAHDHDHKTGLFRGRLCGPCNKDFIGHSRDSIAMLQRAIDYLTNPPAKQLGIEAVYRGG